MKRFLFAVWAGLVGGAVVRAQPIEAELTYYHRVKKAPDTIKVTIIEESPGLIAYQISNRVEKVAAADVQDVVYQTSSALLRQEYRRAQRNEDEIDKAADGEARQKAVRQALESYQALLPQVAESRLAQRQVAFKLARLAARLAEDDPGQLKPAIAALSKFLQEHGGGWQVSQAARLLAGLQLEEGDQAAALKTFESLAAKPDLPRETRQEYQLLAVRALMRDAKHDEARRQLKSIQARLLPEDAPVTARVNIYLAGCQGASGDPKDVQAVQKQLMEVLGGEADPAVKALACNTLGDVYRRARRDEDAFWRYLMVDVMYNQDPEEQARALYHLGQLFDQVKKDPARAQECRERLLTQKQFSGAEYRRLALREK